jgi:hypothetical protein
MQRQTTRRSWWWVSLTEALTRVPEWRPGMPASEGGAGRWRTTAARSSGRLPGRTGFVWGQRPPIRQSGRTRLWPRARHPLLTRQQLAALVGTSAVRTGRLAIQLRALGWVRTIQSDDSPPDSLRHMSDRPHRLALAFVSAARPVSQRGGDDALEEWRSSACVHAAASVRTVMAATAVQDRDSASF